MDFGNGGELPSLILSSWARIRAAFSGEIYEASYIGGYASRSGGSYLKTGEIVAGSAA